MTTRIDVLDHGFVELLDVMGDEQEVARAARISYGSLKERTWEEDARLIRYLHENHHTTPFEMIEVKFRAKMPIFVARQWVRHRTANINEFSMRYADPERIADGEEIDYYTPAVWRGKSITNKQGSEGAIDNQQLATDMHHDATKLAIETYRALQSGGVANELARIDLPVSVYTEWVWKNDLHNVLHFFALRTDSHAQWEMQAYANAMVELLRERLPRLMDIVWPR